MLNEIWAAYAAAFALGTAHALEVDHMVAVSAFVGGNPRLAPAVGFGIRWGVGHSVAVLAAGGLLAWSGFSVPASAQQWLEAGVGLALIGVGVWAWFNARRLHLHVPAEHGSHGHLHAHVPGATDHHHSPEHHHPHALTLIGAVHGLAGTAPVVALIPVTLMPGVGAALGYLLAFGMGTILGMGAYAGLASLAVARAASSLRFARALAFGTALLSMAVGSWWLVRVATT
jgi:hypothetical protein